MQGIDFFYDLRSPYAYLAWNRRSVLQQTGAQLTYVPVSIDVLLNCQAGKDAWAEYSDPLAPPKRRHLMSDIPRMARFWGIPLGGPFTFKPESKRAMCLATALQSSGLEQEEFITFALNTLWRDARNLADAAVFEELVSVSNLSSFCEQSALDELKANTELAYQSGIFGVPSFRYNDEVFFGADRMDVLAFALQDRDESTKASRK
ncbi:MAG: hypothetical protein GWP50_02800 [Proteobacteria bacterium]|nr:hypothetical protein [Pseudomonadota bacterium]